jgi:hypothetical protein
MPDDKIAKWKDSVAKETLKEDIVSGKVTADMKPKQVFAMHKELYEPYAKNFTANYRSLQKSIQNLWDRRDEDHEAVFHDLEVYPRSKDDLRGYPRWDGSAAQWLLKQDVSAGKHKEMKPKVLQQTREEYKPYPLKVFSGHVNQEKTSRLGKSYWLNRKKDKKKKN